MSTESAVPEKVVEQIRGVATGNSDRSTHKAQKRLANRLSDGPKAKEASNRRMKREVATDDLDGIGDNDSIGG